jgi:hypothetical protein
MRTMRKRTGITVQGDIALTFPGTRADHAALLHDIEFLPHSADGNALVSGRDPRKGEI